MSQVFEMRQVTGIQSTTYNWHLDYMYHTSQVFRIQHVTGVQFDANRIFVPAGQCFTTGFSITRSVPVPNHT